MVEHHLVYGLSQAVPVISNRGKICRIWTIVLVKVTPSTALIVPSIL